MLYGIKNTVEHVIVPGRHYFFIAVLDGAPFGGGFVRKEDYQLDSVRAYFRSPYEAMFGHKVRIGLASSGLPSEVVDTLQTEEELEEALRGTRSLDDPIEDSGTNEEARAFTKFTTTL